LPLREAIEASHQIQLARRVVLAWLAARRQRGAGWHRSVEWPEALLSKPFGQGVLENGKQPGLYVAISLQGVQLVQRLVEALVNGIIGRFPVAQKSHGIPAQRRDTGLDGTEDVLCRAVVISTGLSSC
jgi:hypothetical protein